MHLTGDQALNNGPVSVAGVASKASRDRQKYNVGRHHHRGLAWSTPAAERMGGRNFTRQGKLLIKTLRQISFYFQFYVIYESVIDLHRYREMSSVYGVN
jgi:hypothetical protein